MAVTFDHNRGAVGKRIRKDAIEYRLIFAASFIVFLIAAVAERLMPWRWLLNRRPGTQGRSVLGQARESAGICTAYAFMG
jgi:hypothetical protein